MIKPRLVFVVDDDQSARSGIARLLRTAGHDVRAFASAEEFLDDLDPETFGCLVLDVRMPGMSGEELQAELKALGVRLPTIVISADDDSDTRRAAHRMNAAAFIRNAFFLVSESSSAEMTMIGNRIPRLWSSACSSSPDIPGIRASSTRQSDASGTTSSRK